MQLAIVPGLLDQVFCFYREIWSVIMTNNVRSNGNTSTRSVHAGEQREKAYNSLVDPIVQSATYTFADTNDLRDYMDNTLLGMADDRTEYGRNGNPTVRAAERRIAALENAVDCVLFNSGMAAITTSLLAFLGAGKHLILTRDSYRRSHQFCLNVLKRFGVTCSIVPVGDYKALEEAITPETKLIFSETPTNPYLRCIDLECLVDIAKRNDVLSVIDSTFATPFNLQPLEYGVDLVIHSGSKYLGGHNDILAGAVCGQEHLTGLIRQLLGIMGSIMAPEQASLLIRGLKTLGLRISRHNENGQRVADCLEGHSKVDRVWYPGLRSHPDYQIASDQMDGCGGVVSFELTGSSVKVGQFVDAVQIPYIAPSLGGVESLIEQPAVMSYYDLEPEERAELGIKDNLVRLAVGIEDSEDLIEDLNQALDKV